MVLAAALRFPGLDLRPMHADEAVHAAKMARLLEQGRYQYDPEEFHGPTLNYLTLLPARLRGAARYADLDEVILRSVPAAIGVLLVAAHVLLIPVIGFPAAALAALLAAVSPAMVYYSRYYIQETLLVCFSFGALISICRYLQTPRAAWAVSAGACVGLMHATKETWVIAAGLDGGRAVSDSGVRAAGAAQRRAPSDRRWRGRHLLAADPRGGGGVGPVLLLVPQPSPRRHRLGPRLPDLRRAGRRVHVLARCIPGTTTSASSCTRAPTEAPSGRRV